MREKLMRFMMGRYGTDTLNTHIMFFVLFLIFINIFVHSYVISLLSYALLILEIYRSFSKNIYKRYSENEAYMKMIAPISRTVTLYKKRLSDRNHRYYRCPQCHQLVRIPRGRGKVEVVCPKCHTHFDKRS